MTVAFDRGGCVIAEAPHDLPARCASCGSITRAQFVGADKPLRVKCTRTSCGVVYFQKMTMSGALVLAGFEVL